MEMNEESVFYKQKILNDQEKSIIKAYNLCQKIKKNIDHSMESNIELTTL